MSRRNNKRKYKDSYMLPSMKNRFRLKCDGFSAYWAPVGIKTQTMAVLAAVVFTLRCRGNGTPNPCRVSATLYPLSIPAIKLNGHTNHIANVSMKPEPQRSVEIAESISEIAHWHTPLSLTARRSSLIQNASNIQICPKRMTCRQKTTDRPVADSSCLFHVGES